MPTTTIHVPDDFLRRIDAAARSRGVSRNRFVLAACDEALAHQAGQWPEGFFDPPTDPENLRLLREATVELEHAVRAGRRNRGDALL